jgi:hypothetical protein
VETGRELRVKTRGVKPVTEGPVQHRERGQRRDGERMASGDWGLQPPTFFEKAER